MIVAYKYGLHAPLDWGDDCENQLRKQNAFWNKLVEIERAHREKVRSVAMQDAEAAEARAAYEAADAVVTALIEEVRRRRQKVRSKKLAEDAWLTNDLRSAKDVRKAAAEREKAARKAAYAKGREELRALEDEHFAAVKAARQAANADGLWWATPTAAWTASAWRDPARSRKALSCGSGGTAARDACAIRSSRACPLVTCSEAFTAKPPSVRWNAAAPAARCGP